MSTSRELKWFSCYIYHNFHILFLKRVIPNFLVCLVFLGRAFSSIRDKLMLELKSSLVSSRLHGADCRIMGMMTELFNSARNVSKIYQECMYVSWRLETKIKKINTNQEMKARRNAFFLVFHILNKITTTTQHPLQDSFPPKR